MKENKFYFNIPKREKYDSVDSFLSDQEAYINSFNYDGTVKERKEVMFSMDQDEMFDTPITLHNYITIALVDNTGKMVFLRNTTIPDSVGIHLPFYVSDVDFKPLTRKFGMETVIKISSEKVSSLLSSDLGIHYLSNKVIGIKSFSYDFIHGGDVSLLNIDSYVIVSVNNIDEVIAMMDEHLSKTVRRHFTKGINRFSIGATIEFNDFFSMMHNKINNIDPLEPFYRSMTEPSIQAISRITSNQLERLFKNVTFEKLISLK